MPSPLLIADSPGIGIAFGPPQWGIFNQDGSPVLIANSVNSVEYARDYRISDYPQEKGSFQSYNKVQVPYQAKVSFMAGSTRRDILNNIENKAASLDLVSVVTPEITYPNANIVHYSFSRTSRSGVTLVLIDVWLEEIRIAGASSVLSGGQDATNSQSQTSPTSQPATASTPSTLADTQSTNGATPTQSGQVQALNGTESRIDLTSGPSFNFDPLPPLPPK